MLTPEEIESFIRQRSAESAGAVALVKWPSSGRMDARMAEDPKFSLVGAFQLIVFLPRTEAWSSRKSRAKR